jgi:hypothetical protein
MAYVEILPPVPQAASTAATVRGRLVVGTGVLVDAEVAGA